MAGPSYIHLGYRKRTQAFLSVSAMYSTFTPPTPFESTWYFAQATASGRLSSPSFLKLDKNLS